MNVLLIDDHRLVREGIKTILRGINPSIDIVECSSLERSIDHCKRESFDLVVLDLELTDTSGMDSLICFKDARPELPVIVLSALTDVEKIQATIEYGAMCFISKTSEFDELSRAFKLVLDGGVYLPEGEVIYSKVGMNKSADSSSSATDILTALSPRQREVLQLLLRGMPNKLISKELSIAENTVKTHIAKILDLLQVSNRTEAVYVAARAGVPIFSNEMEHVLPHAGSQ